MTRAAAFLVLIPLAGSAVGRKLTADEQAAALTRVREYARSYTANLPNYTCIQATRQSMIGPGARASGPPGLSLRAAEIEEQISFVNRREIRTVTKINGSPPSAGGRAPVTVSQGEFGNLLDTIFDPKSGAEIHWDREAKLDDRQVYVFAYRVPQSSGYTLMESNGQTKVPFEGFVYADRRTGAVVRIEMKCTQLPAKSEYRALALTLDYKPAKIEDQEYLLPYGFTMQFGMNATGVLVSAQYKSYRRFSADSTVTFDSDFNHTNAAVAKSGAQGAPAPEPASAAAGNTAIGKDSSATGAAAIAENQKAAPDQQPLAEPLPLPAPPFVATPVEEAKAAPADQPAAAPPTAPDSVFRASTQLVQVSVIAQDQQGKPVTDLKREDFQIFDNGAPQEIRLFLAERPEVQQKPRPGGTFSNQPGDGTTVPGSTGRGAYSVILFDNLVTGFGDPDETGTGFGIQKVLQVIRALPVGEKVAIYATGRRLQVVREFTTDRDSLEQSLRAWKPSPDDAVTGTALCLGKPDVAEDCRRVDALQRLPNFNEQLQQIADHLSGVPGRKNLIWMANRYPIGGGPAIQKLMNSGVAIYPVDDAGFCPTCPPPQAGAMQALAAMTGGIAYFGRNDLDVAVSEAIEDGRMSYTLGFYQPTEEPAQVHQLVVRVMRPGVSLRYRAGYETEAPRRRTASAVADLVDTMNRPIDATAIGLTASATRVKDRLELSVTLDLSGLDLELKEGRWKGKTELVARFMTADGVWAGDVLAQTITLNLRPATYASMLQRGVVYRKELPVPKEAVELKVLAGNLATGKTGTLTIPLSELAPSPSNPK